MLPAVSRPASAHRFPIPQVVRHVRNRPVFPVDNWTTTSAAACLASRNGRPSAASWHRQPICAAPIRIRHAHASTPCSFWSSWNDLLLPPTSVKAQPCRQVLHKPGLIHRFRIGATIVVCRSTARIRAHAPLVAYGNCLRQQEKKQLSTETAAPLLLLLLIYIRFFKRQGTSSP